jgi:hypothetical protein
MREQAASLLAQANPPDGSAFKLQFQGKNNSSGYISAATARRQPQ